jgi:hypothetical protein
MPMVVFWVVTPCELVVAYLSPRGVDNPEYRHGHFHRPCEPQASVVNWTQIMNIQLTRLWKINKINRNSENNFRRMRLGQNILYINNYTI